MRLPFLLAVVLTTAQLASAQGDLALPAPPISPDGSAAVEGAVVLDASLVGPIVPAVLSREGPALWKGGLVGEVVGVAAGVGLALLIDEVDGSAGRVATVLPALGLPVGAAVGVVAYGRRRGVEGSVPDALVGSAVGLVPPLVLTGLTALAVRNDHDSAAVLGAAAVLTAVALPAVAASVGYRRGAEPEGTAERRVDVVPVAIRAPTGETGAGLSLRVGL